MFLVVQCACVGEKPVSQIVLKHKNKTKQLKIWKTESDILVAFLTKEKFSFHQVRGTS